MLTKNQIEWAKRKERANNRRRDAYFVKTLSARTERQRLREEALSKAEDEAAVRRIAATGLPVDSTRERLLDLVDMAKRRPCLDCDGVFPPEVMDFDHRDSEQKCFNISRGRKHVGQARLQAEIAKCDLVCSNCHRIRTWRRRQGLPAVLPEPEYFI